MFMPRVLKRVMRFTLYKKLLLLRAGEGKYYENLKLAASLAVSDEVTRFIGLE